MALNFPNPDSIQTYTNAGITWTWNPTLGVWSTEGNTGDSDFLTEAEGDVRYLSKTIADTANGSITFKSQTTHENGISADANVVATGRIVAGTDFRVPNADANSGANVGVRLAQAGLVIATTGTADEDVWRSYLNGNNTKQSWIKGNGTASFATVNFSSGGNSARYEHRGIGYSSSGNAIDITNKTDGANQTDRSALQAKFNVTHAGNTLTSFIARMHTGTATFSGISAFKVANFLNTGASNADWDGSKAVYGFHSELGDGDSKVYHIYCPSKAQTYLGGPIIQPLQSGANPLSINGGGASTGFGVTAAGLVRTKPTFDSTNSSKSNFIKIDTNGYLRRYDGTIRNMENVQNVSTFGLLSPTELVKQLQPRIWTDKESGEFGLGFIAEEVQAVAGDTAVTFIEEDGQQLVNDVHGSAIEVALVRALQEALTRIEELESNTLQPLYSTFADLPNASDHHGKTAHVHDEGALYFAHAGNWVKLQNA